MLPIRTRTPKIETTITTTDTDVAATEVVDGIISETIPKIEEQPPSLLNEMTVLSSADSKSDNLDRINAHIETSENTALLEIPLTDESSIKRAQKRSFSPDNSNMKVSKLSSNEFVINDEKTISIDTAGNCTNDDNHIELIDESAILKNENNSIIAVTEHESLEENSLLDHAIVVVMEQQDEQQPSDNIDNNVLSLDDNMLDTTEVTIDDIKSESSCSNNDSNTGEIVIEENADKESIIEPEQSNYMADYMEPVISTINSDDLIVTDTFDSNCNSNTSDNLLTVCNTSEKLRHFYKIQNFGGVLQMQPSSLTLQQHDQHEVMVSLAKTVARTNDDGDNGTVGLSGLAGCDDSSSSNAALADCNGENSGDTAVEELEPTIQNLEPLEDDPIEQKFTDAENYVLESGEISADSGGKFKIDFF